MRWEERLLDVFEDLEQQAEGLALAERDREVAELGRAEYASIDLASRFHASTGRQVLLSCAGAGTLQGRLARVGAGWCLVEASEGGREWLVRLDAVTTARGLSELALTEPARPLVARLGLGSVLRSLSDEAGRVVVVTTDGRRTAGHLRRVGADFVELVDEEASREVELVAFRQVAAVLSG